MLRRFPTLLLTCLLAACATRGPEQSVVWQEHQAQTARLEYWSLAGRLNIRQGNAADTINLNWTQAADETDIRFSSTLLGLGAQRVQGNHELVTVSKAGEEPFTLPGLDSLTREYLAYDFPAAYLLWWVRGLPVPELTARTGFNTQMLLQTLEQRESGGLLWQLEFDRYQMQDGYLLPGLIQVRSQGVQLIFRIQNWSVDHSDD